MRTQCETPLEFLLEDPCGASVWPLSDFPRFVECRVVVLAVNCDVVKLQDHQLGVSLPCFFSNAFISSSQ